MNQESLRILKDLKRIAEVISVSVDSLMEANYVVDRCNRILLIEKRSAFVVFFGKKLI